MTLAPEHPNCALHEVTVRFSPDGTPIAIRHDGKIWLVDPDVHAAHWYAQQDASDTRTEHWQVQAKLPTAGAELRTFRLHREAPDTTWRLESRE